MSAPPHVPSISARSMLQHGRCTDTVPLLHHRKALSYNGTAGSHLCPRSLDCARAGRHFCQQGSSHCGPCLRPLVENSHGRCVIKRRHLSHSTQSAKGKISPYPELDEELDILSAIISEQRTETRLPAPPSQDVPKPKSKELSEPGPAHTASATEQPTSTSAASVLPVSLTPPPIATNHTPALLRGPVIVPHPSNDTSSSSCLASMTASTVIFSVASPDPYVLRTRLSSVAIMSSASNVPRPADRPFVLTLCMYFFSVLSSVFVVGGSVALIIAGTCWVRLQKSVRLTQKVDYPAYGLMRAQTFDNVPGDKKLAHSAQMYHYQHQKQQMLSLEKHREGPKVPDSGASTDEENEDGDFTVYECPGLAPTGEMEVKNPLFDDSTLYFQRFHK
ncbi:neural proliferation differentiation and control protein 1-like [Sphaeramia orbicularis]|uniref:neural proliferation differentiation and control protein 1-like n=1 Tax=Sphaeramia orbicularis TaxID=375764 RepID=UPI00117DEED3|nr:neural proliferation differentiation and control protein 1-like [Sphaeramia orbicularis]